MFSKAVGGLFSSTVYAIGRSRRTQEVAALRAFRAVQAQSMMPNRICIVLAVSREFKIAIEQGLRRQCCRCFEITSLIFANLHDRCDSLREQGSDNCPFVLFEHWHVAPTSPAVVRLHRTVCPMPPRRALPFLGKARPQRARTKRPCPFIPLPTSSFRLTSRTVASRRPRRCRR